MTERLMPLALVVMLAVLSSGCQLIGNIFQAGFVVGILVVFGVVGLIVWGITRLF